MTSSKLELREVIQYSWISLTDVWAFFDSLSTCLEKNMCDITVAVYETDVLGV